jgi:hypothetical protein
MLRCMAAGFTEFRLAPHPNPLGDRRGVEVVGIWSNGALVGTLYPMEGGCNASRSFPPTVSR